MEVVPIEISKLRDAGVEVPEIATTADMRFVASSALSTGEHAVTFAIRYHDVDGAEIQVRDARPAVWP